jgi:hypothetical protein
MIARSSFRRFVKSCILSAGIAAAACLTSPTTIRAAEGDEKADKSWKIEIRPSEYSRAAVSGAVAAEPAKAGSEAPVSAASGNGTARISYADAYNAIPFSRSEYEANPAFRHEAAMELMFGVLRPMTNFKMMTPYFSRYPDMFRYRFSVYPYPFSGGSGGGNMNLYWRTSVLAY